MRSIAVFLLSFFVSGVISAQRNSIYFHLRFGNPSQATNQLPLYKDNYLHVKDGFTLSYNASKRTPNWVAWRLQGSDVGEIKRSTRFEKDVSLPNELPKSDYKDYSNTGFDRGHNCPSKDRTTSVSANEETFLMSNIMPQHNDNNGGPWEKLEQFCRDEAKKGKELYIASGPYGRGGENNINQRLETIGHNRVVVPSHTWKVVLILPKENMALKEITAENVSVIAVLVPNKGGIKKHSWKRYITSVDEIEKLTGYNFFSTLTKEIQTKIEATKYAK